MRCAGIEAMAGALSYPWRPLLRGANAAEWIDSSALREYRLSELAPEHSGDPIAAADLAAGRREREMFGQFRLHSACFGYVFPVTARS
jgi:hypothetical protein